ncbi:SigE family RNA polymerase sigma factor [Nocardioides hungaricus]
MGTDAEFEAYVAARWTSLVRSAYLMGCAVPDAEDLVQTTLADLYRRWDRVSAAGDPDGYVYRSLLNRFRRSRRRRWWGEQPVGDLPEDRAGSSDDSTDGLDLRAALRRVPAERRAVLVLKFFHDLTEPEIATLLGTPLGTVKSRTARGMEDLRRLYLSGHIHVQEEA